VQGIGNGLPLAAVMTTPEIAAVLAQRIHFNTYGGNPVSSAAGRAVLRAVDEDSLQANCKKVPSPPPPPQIKLFRLCSALWLSLLWLVWPFVHLLCLPAKSHRNPAQDLGLSEAPGFDGWTGLPTPPV